MSYQMLRIDGRIPANIKLIKITLDRKKLRDYIDLLTHVTPI